ncbi:hypothetical protein M8C13_06140 [Crossiella sp. SN42]|uniref:zinc finger domain-containing protein n=1 Tax=Crossiella sp. SN42 TaxID=2944808 RepID=UPI00207CBACD|nr:hypothetical protein [Crossiella sp. SN42]MCO1575339.1 hypothetical protein [Crossiella sp. SN42]
MNEADIRAVLAAAMAFDHRKLPGQADIAAWTEAGVRGGWARDEAVEAVAEHYTHSTEFLRPGHLTAIIRHRRTKPPAVTAVAALPATPPADPERIGRLVAELGARLGWRRPPEASSLIVECPACHARPKSACRRRVFRGPHRGEFVAMSGVHASRSELAARASPAGHGHNHPQ